MGLLGVAWWKLVLSSKSKREEKSTYASRCKALPCVHMKESWLFGELTGRHETVKREHLDSMLERI
jgi:hypothetical protein